MTLEDLDYSTRVIWTFRVFCCFSVLFKPWAPWNCHYMKKYSVKILQNPSFSFKAGFSSPRKEHSVIYSPCYHKPEWIYFSSVNKGYSKHEWQRKPFILERGHVWGVYWRFYYIKEWSCELYVCQMTSKCKKKCEPKNFLVIYLSFCEIYVFLVGIFFHSQFQFAHFGG